MARGEIYAQVSCDYYDNAKMIAAGEAAELLYVRALCLANRLLLDGKISEEHLVALRFRDGRRRADALVRAGLWERTDGGWIILGWAERNRSRLEIMEIRARERERKKAERLALRAARAGGQSTDTGPFDDDSSGKRPAGQPPESAGTDHGRGADVRSDSASHRSSINEQRSTNIDQPDEVDPVGVLACVVPGPSDPPSASQPQTATPDLSDVRAKLNRTLPLHAITGAKAVGA